MKPHGEQIIVSPSIILLTSFLFAISFIGEVLPPVRYIKYGILPIMLILMTTDNNLLRNIKMRFSSAWVFLLLYSLVSIIILYPMNSFGYVQNGLKDIFFILCFLIPLLMFCTYKFPIKQSWFILVFCWLISLFFRDSSDLSFTTSKAIYESPISFVFGGFAIYALYKKERLFLFANLILMMISLKRIAIIAFFSVLIVYYLPERIKRFIFHPITFTSFIILAFFSTMVFASGYFDKIIYSFFHARSDTISMGRYLLYKGIYYDIIQNPSILIFGRGAGRSYSLINEFVLSRFEFGNLHSDILKIGYEFGLIALSTFVYMFIRTNSYLSRSIVAYIFICFLTDNIIIFSHIMFYLLSLVYSEEILILNTGDSNRQLPG